jgi:hypothetical protein
MSSPPSAGVAPAPRQHHVRRGAVERCRRLRGRRAQAVAVGAVALAVAGGVRVERLDEERVGVAYATGGRIIFDLPLYISFE